MHVSAPGVQEAEPDALCRSLQEAWMEGSAFDRVDQELPRRGRSSTGAGAGGTGGGTRHVPQRVMRRVAGVVMDVPQAYRHAVRAYQRAVGLPETGCDQPVLVGCLLPLAACSLADILE